MLAEADTLLGRELAGYRLTKVVGRGGMSTVYLGRRIDDDNAEAAIKVLQESPGGHATSHTRFCREAQTVASLQHDHILPVLDYGEWQGLSYMVMPLAAGGTLRRRLASTPGPFPLAVAAAYAVQLASALDYAHQHTIVHGDVKPSNVLLDGQGRLLLADFGLARHFARPLYGDEATTLTSPDEVLGTPDYMAPEQFLGHSVGPAADIYALGVVLYLLATGLLPFEGETPVAVGIAHLHDIPLSPRLFRADLPAPAAAAILCALAKNPVRRFASAGTLAQAFAAGIEERWTAENRAHARMLERQRRSGTSARSKTARSRGPARAPARSFRTSLAALAGVVLLASGLAAALAVQRESLWSATPTSQVQVVSATVPERLPATATYDRGADVVMRYSGSQVWALWPDGSRRWTVWVDAALAGPPMVQGDLVALTTVIGTRYTVRANDGAILSRVLAAVTPATGKGHHGGKGDGNDSGD
jgi:hypothetical protein